MNKRLPHVKHGWELVSSPVADVAIASSTKQKEKKRVWKAVSFVDYTEPIRTFEEHPFTLQEVALAKAKQREIDLLAREKEVARKETEQQCTESRLNAIAEYNRRCLEQGLCPGKGRGRSKQIRAIQFE